MLAAFVLVLASVTAPAPAPATAGAPGPDSDGDGIPDADEDTNHNGVVDPGESDPKNTDTDGDNVPDDVERRMGSNPNDAFDVPPIPEPLYIDLIRNLGSGRGELEVNVLAATSYRRTAEIPTIGWGPEIEYAPLKGFGLELEMPMADGRVEGVKGGAQVTLGSFAARRLEFGVLGTHEQSVQTVGSGTLLAVLTGVRFSSHVQAITIVGPTLTTARGRKPVGGGQLSPSVFYQVTRRLTFGVELGHHIQAGERSSQTVLPQVHVSPDSHVKIQLGIGGTTEGDGRLHPLTAIRVCWER